MATASKEQRENARISATVWENVFRVCQENADRRTDIDRNIMRTLGTFALIVGGEYRRLANAGKYED